MAYTTADLVKYQAQLVAGMQAGELRVRTPEVFNNLRINTEMMIPSHNEIKNSAKRTTGEVNYFARSSRALGTGGETHNHTGVVGSSAIVVPSWTPYDDKFSYAIKQANDSVYNLDQMLMNEIVNINNNFSEGLETIAAAWIHANRSGVNVSTAEGSFSAANDVFEITEDYTNLVASGYRTLQIIKTNLRINKWSAMLTIYADTVGFNKMQALANNGAGNSINTSFQFSGVNFIHSPELDALASALGYTAGYFIAEPENNTAVLDWIPPQNRAGFIGPDNKYGVLIHPTTGILLGTHEYSARAATQDVVTQVQLFSYLSLNASPLTVADETPLYAFALVAAVVA